MTKVEMIFFIVLTMTITSLLYFFYSPVEVEKIEPEFNITSATITLNWFDTEEELQAEVQRLENEYCEEYPEECPDGPDDYSDTAGLSECDWQPEENYSWCEMWLVRPTELDIWTENFEQDVWKTIGHEFYHTSAGEFHDN